MYCGSCGRDIEEGSRYCPWCGAPVQEAPVRRGHGMSAAAAVVLAVAVLAAAIVLGGEDTEPSLGGEGWSEVTYGAVGPTSVSGSEAGLFAVSETTTGTGVEVTVSLSDSVADRYRTFDWYVTSWDGRYQHVPSGDPELTILLDENGAGEYTVSVFCTNDLLSWFPVGETHGVTLTRDCDVTRSFGWEFGGEEHRMETTFRMSDYLAFAKKDADGRDGSLPWIGFGILPNFMTVDPVVASLEESLAAEYAGTHGTPSGQGYAEFILAFVQECFGYELDDDLYGYEEYYAFPLETLFHGKGDCEDTSILCASLYAAAGYDAGVITLPEHAIAAVSVPGYVPSEPAPAFDGRVDVLSVQRGGLTYYGCETTLDTNGYGVGLMNSDWSFNGDGSVTYRDETYRGRGFGLYTVPAGTV